jgi:two-component system phosphate regulon sensor histidine kinase PhoR
MKLNRTYLFIGISSIALLVVLFIQISWIMRTAKIKEELFNEKANIVLAKTAQALASDQKACRDLKSGERNSAIRKIDSLFKYYMNFYNIHIDYVFDVKTDAGPATNSTGFSKFFSPDLSGFYRKSIEDVASNNGMELKLQFPDKKQFIVEEMGTQFITSVVLILIVLILSWHTILSLLKEKRISEHTTDFLNNMTHEFKTPLTNISLAGKMIQKDTSGNESEKIKNYSNIILEENEKLRLQVEQVLSMTALERGEIPIAKTEVDMHQLIQHTVKCLSMQIAEKQGEVVLNLNAKHAIIYGDKTHLAKCLNNLLDNANKYSDGKPHITVETGDSGGDLILIISDKGPGIEKLYHKKVFDKFFRVPTGDVHDVKGFGLGLTYTKKIVELHGGKIELTSEKNEGTSFIITLPHAEGKI